MKFKRKAKSYDDAQKILKLEKRRKFILTKFETFRIFTLVAIFVSVFLFLNFIFDASVKERLGDFISEILAVLIALFLAFIAHSN